VPAFARRGSDAAASTALAACVTGDLAAYRAVKSASLTADPTAGCVVANTPGPHQTRELLGPPTITGGDLDDVVSAADGKNRRTVALQFMEPRASSIDALIGQWLPTGAAITVDGEIVASLSSAEPGTPPGSPGTTLDLPSTHGFPAARAREL